MKYSKKIADAVLMCTQESLLLKSGKATLESRLFTDLSANSVDLIDILFRLEKSLSLQPLKQSDFQYFAVFREKNIKLKDLVQFIEKKLSQST